SGATSTRRVSVTASIPRDSRVRRPCLPNCEIHRRSVMNDSRSIPVNVVSSGATFDTDATPGAVRDTVRERYAAVATGGTSCCGSSCGCGTPVDGDTLLAAIGYDAAQA